MIVHGDARRLSGDGGSALVEAAFLSPIVLFMFLGILEGGGLMLDYLSVSNAASAGVRTAGIAGSEITADFAIVRAVSAESAAIDRDTITRLVVYKATNPTSTVPVGCASATIGTAGLCNVYVTAYLDDPVTSPTFQCGTFSRDQYWCPTTRKAALEGTNGPPDWIGVYVEVEHRMVSGLFGDSRTIRADVVTRIEPESLR